LEVASDEFCSGLAVVHRSLRQWEGVSALVSEWDKELAGAAAAEAVVGSDSKDRPIGSGDVAREGGTRCLEETEQGLEEWAR